MATFPRIALVSLLVMAAAPANSGQTPARSDESYQAATTAILVDVVVRDRQGRPVRDLTAADFEIYEDRVPQVLGSFSVVERSDGIGISVRRRAPGTTTVASVGGGDTGLASDDPLETPPTMAMLFDALSPEALALAQRAALAYLPMSTDTESRVGVFTSEPGLRVLQAYTADVALVRQAVRELTPAGNGRKELETENRVALHDRLRQLDAMQSSPGSGEGGSIAGESGSSLAQSIVERQFVEARIRMMQSFDSLDRDHRGFGTATTLLAVVQSLAYVPGRKSIVYFSEGLPASPALQNRLDTVISAANRANVSVYTIDAAGLRAESALLETRREIDWAGEERLRQTVQIGDPTDGPMNRIVERTEDLLRLDPQGGLARLAEDTGGFLIRDTNDLGSAFRRIDEDNRFHYLLTYSPTNPDFDGKFRTIQVKVKRDDLQVFSRKGYLAVRSSTAPVPSYEAPAVAVLDAGKPPNDFPIHAAGFAFPTPNGATVTPIVVQLRTDALAYQVDRQRGTYSAQAAVVARLKNLQGRVVATLSQQYVLAGDAKDVEQAKQGEILFYRQPELRPGVYTLEAIVHDAIAERASARLSTLTVPAWSPDRLTASSLVCVRRVEEVEQVEESAAALPFYYGNLLLYPNAGEPLRPETDPELFFYFAFHPADGLGETKATAEILNNGRVLASAPVDLPDAAGADGRVQHVGKLPIADFPKGTFELRLVLRQAEQEQVRTAYFRVER
jgi:VWFA-related protein